MKVPDLEIIHSVLNLKFKETEIGGWAKQDNYGTVYIYNKDGSPYAIMPASICMDLLESDEVRGENIIQ